MKRIILQRGKEKSLLRFHPWVFSGAILRKEGSLTDGDLVEVFDVANNYLATGHYHNSSIAVRIISFNRLTPDYQFWKLKIQQAIEYRKIIGLIDNPDTTMFRLINGEGDYMPGLIVDWYNGNLVMQFHSMGMFLIRNMLVDIFKSLFPELISIYNKSATTLSEGNTFADSDELLYGELPEQLIVKENGISFIIDIPNGQKTGFFIDQRNNRQLAGTFAKGKKVLNLFCYSGGFSAYALQNDAQLVHSVDISKKAIELTENNISLNSPTGIHQSFAENVFDFLENMEDNFYDVIILDPPAFAKHHKIKEQGTKGYRNINRKAMSKIKPGGILFTFSCSQAISKEDFQTIIFSSAAMEHKNVQIIKQLQPAPDHPISIFHPEGNYLKGFALAINN